MQELSNIEEIITLLTEADDLYYNNVESSLSDAEYDTLRNLAKKLDPTNKYFIGVGSAVRGGKVPLPVKMGSLDQLHNDAEIAKWLSDKQLFNDNIVITDKLDGVSCLIVYDNTGNLQVAYSRGDGVEGADITRHIKNISNVPKKISGKMLVRGELIMNKETFLEKYAKEFKNPRNMVAGLFNRKESRITALNDVDFIAYEIVGS